MLRYRALWIAVLSAVSLTGQPALGQEMPAEPHRPRAWVVLPHAYHTPETGVAGGVVVGYYPGGGLGARPSSVLTSLTVTSHRQLIAEVLPELYLGGGRFWLRAEGRAMKYPDIFYGIGNRTTPEMEEDFTFRTLDLSLRVQREVSAGTWLGARAQLRADDLVEVAEGGLLATGDIPGSGGGTAVGLGLVATRDTRDRVLAPRRGLYAEARWTGYSPALGSDHEFGLATLDMRGYLPLGPGVAALHGYGEAVQGEAPFTLMPRLGGSRILRGYREGRFRDDLLGVAEAEYRFPIFWRFGGTVFGGVGDVAAGFGDLPRAGEIEHAVGAGLRFRLNEAGVKIRLDVARGREGGGLYLSIGEAF